MSVSVGELAPDFELDGVDGRTGEDHRYRLSDFRGAPVVLVFYPGDNTPVCRQQLSSYTEQIGEFAALGAQVLALSPQSVESHREFARRTGGFAFPLLADDGKDVARRYGNLGLLDLYRRSTVVVDADGVVGYTHRYIGPGLAFKPVEVLVEVLSALDDD